MRRELRKEPERILTFKEKTKKRSENYCGILRGYQEEIQQKSVRCHKVRTAVRSF